MGTIITDVDVLQSLVIREDMSASDSNPVFVVGFFRSGTSLLYSMLNQHPQVALMYECDVWDFPEVFTGLRFRRNWLERQEFYNTALSRHRLTFGRSLRGLEQVRTPVELYRTFSEGKGASMWGEKSPLYCPRLLSLAKRYPAGSFILLWRDPVEIYRSLVCAGRNERYFARPGMLSRLIFHQEQMLQQARQLRRAGARIHHVTYGDLVDKPKTVCSGLCQFLEIPFDEKMLELAGADLSAVFKGRHHDQLRRGKIQRQQFSEQVLDSAVVHKLERFRSRWGRLQREWLGMPSNGSIQPEPGLAERFFHKISGSYYWVMHDVKRVLLEFLPLPWLRTYRQTKSWYLTHRAELARERVSLRQQLSQHWVTILAGYILLAGVVALHIFANPHLVFIPFYLIPCSFLALIVGRNWGTFAAAASAIIGPVLQSFGDPDYAFASVLLWNCVMRFVVFETVVLLLDRVRIDATATVESK